jgi:hypothetical protein
MKLISHRGNLNSRFEGWENEPTYVDLAISKGYDVEVDVWYVDGNLYLGHDKPQYDVDFRWFSDRIGKLWIHCKNIEALSFFRNLRYEFNYFWHETDTVTLTSLNHIWAYPGKQPIEGSIAVMPEINNDDTTKCIGICSDYIEKYKNENSI